LILKKVEVSENCLDFTDLFQTVDDFSFCVENEGSPNSVFRRRFKHQHSTEAN